PGRPAPSRSPSPPPVTTPWPTASPSSTPSWLPSPTPRSTTASCPTLTLHDALPIYGQTALMMAVRNRNPELVKLLVSAGANAELDRKSTRLNSSHVKTSYAAFCLKKKTAQTAREWAVLELASGLLSGSPSSRLYRRR